MPGCYVVSSRDGGDTYTQSVYFPDNESMQDDAEALVVELGNTRPNVEHVVMSADDFESEYGEGAAERRKAAAVRRKAEREAAESRQADAESPGVEYGIVTADDEPSDAQTVEEVNTNG